jgi:hypothetical protein
MLAFERIAEEKIREALAAGELDNLPGKGKPLPFDDPIGLRPEDRLAYIVLKNSGFLPEHLHLRKELETHFFELAKFREHLRARLGKLLERLRPGASPRAEEQPVKSSRRFFPMLLELLRKRREQSSVLQRGKEVSSSDSFKQHEALRRAYFEERRWLRNRLQELAKRVAETAQRLQEALVEREIRDRRPAALLLGSPLFSVEKILLEFDREFPNPDEPEPKRLRQKSKCPTDRLSPTDKDIRWS